MAAFAPFFKEPMISLMPLIRKASELYLNEFTAAKYKYSEKFTIKSALFHLNQRKCKSEFLSGTQGRSFLSDS